MSDASGYSQESRAFLSRANRYLAEGDLHQASEKGWGAAARMAKAVAQAHGWTYDRHDEFFKVMRQIESLSGDPRLRSLRATANELHGFFYLHETLLDARDISRGLEDVALMLDILQPLTQSPS